jgi:aminoglycoside phosphotransferase family enzyme/predicted kinase
MEASDTAEAMMSSFAQVKETHAAVLLMAGDRVYKFKKPVNLGFLDFGTLRARKAACEREVALNRRFAPDVYEGVADVVGPDGRVCEHLVVMRRMPEERRLSRLVRAGRPVDGCLRRIARALAAWHAKAPRGPHIDRQGDLPALRSRWTASFDQVRGLNGGAANPIALGTLTEIERLTLRFLDGRAPLFARRVAAGRVVDGHGDLLAEDVFCLDDGPRVLDCLEFDDNLRYVDGLDDAAFLAMDLERLGAPELAEAFLRAYAEFSGDPAPPALWHHYVAYRAFVRAKVACLRHWQGDEAAAARARDLADLTLRHLRLGAVRLILVGGPPGSGKTTLADALADRLGVAVLSSDRVRKELAGVGPRESAAAPYGEGIYRPEWTERTYGELLKRAETLMGLGETVILDASWTDPAHRAAAAAAARRAHADLIAFRCAVPAHVAAERVATRARTVSDADKTVAAIMAARTPSWPDAIEIDTGGPVEDTLARALTAIHGPDPVPRYHRPRMEPD